MIHDLTQVTCELGNKVFKKEIYNLEKKTGHIEGNIKLENVKKKDIKSYLRTENCYMSR